MCVPQASCDESFAVDHRQMAFEDYAEKMSLTSEQVSSLKARAFQLVANVIHASRGQMQTHPVNDGIHQSGAQCFSYMRADLGITRDFKPVLFEINEFPNVNEDAPSIAEMQHQSLRELFRMLGLDRQHPVEQKARARYQEENSGRWTLLDVEENVALANRSHQYDTP